MFERSPRRWVGLLAAGVVAVAGCQGTASPDQSAAPSRSLIDGGASDAPIGARDAAADHGEAPALDGGANPSGLENPFSLPAAVSSGGPVLASPHVQAIYFAEFPYAAEMDRLLANLAASPYWKQVTSEYGVGPLTVLPSDQSAVEAPGTVTNVDLPGLFRSALMAHSSTLGPPRADTIYALFLPPTSTLRIGSSTFCGRGAPSAFHGELTASGITVPVVVVPTCSSFAGAPSLTGADALAPPLSHELVEAATDPLANTHPAFDTTDPAHIMWTVAVSGGEVADLCENEAPNLVIPADIGFPVPRVWSNAAARGVGGPCVPMPPGAAYFTAVAHLLATVRVALPGRDPADVPALIAPAGAAASVTVDFLAGVGAPASWAVLAIEFHGPESVTNLSSRLAQAVAGNAGDTRSIPIVAPAMPSAGVFPLIILSHSSQGALHLWVGAIQRR
jgi:hypothetical protein